MYRTALRLASRPSLRGTAVRSAPCRFASTAAPASKSGGSWKGSAARWGLAVAGVYYYNTSFVFADEALSQTQTLSTPAPYAEPDMPTIEALIKPKREETSTKPAEATDKKTEPAKPNHKPDTQAQSMAALEGSPEPLEDEAGQEGAFNPETGEINWDCPCLGGMAHGPCGEEFKAAFSCFVYSAEEPKGMDCIEKFQGMQECFREYPDIYGSELEDDEPSEVAPEVAAEGISEPHSVDRRQLREEHASPPERESIAQAHGFKQTESKTPAKWDDAAAADEPVLKEAQKGKEEKKIRPKE